MEVNLNFWPKKGVLYRHAWFMVDVNSNSFLKTEGGPTLNKIK